jgi:hypothetical protein
MATVVPRQPPPKPGRKKAQVARVLELTPITDGPPIDSVPFEYGGGPLGDTYAHSVRPVSPGRRNQVKLGVASAELDLCDSVGDPGHPIDLDDEGGAAPATAHTGTTDSSTQAAQAAPTPISRQTTQAPANNATNVTRTPHPVSVVNPPR